MNKILLALRKAQSERNWGAPFTGQIADLLTDEQFTTTRSRITLRRSRRRGRGAADDHHRPQRSGGSDELLAAFHNATSPAAEQYRKLFVEIDRASRVRDLRILLIASALAEEGKTT